MVQRRQAVEWTDPLGQTYGVGDFVAVATINGKSPQQVIARVEAIYLDDSKGEPYLDRHFEYNPETKEHKRWTTQSCAVLATPVIDGRGFWRSNNSPWAKKNDPNVVAKKVTYSIPGNIVKVNFRESS